MIKLGSINLSSNNYCKVDESTIVIETSADRVRIEFTKWAVSTKNVAANQPTN